ncbi:MAG: GIY-YIG nuclease family protein [Anaerolineae bacterium]|nr:GIY-YIG nuclease family protein [Anaerolineae bacterium]
MNPSLNSTNTSESDPSEINVDWEPQAWVYFLWVAVGHHVYCKIGYSKSPGSRYRQILGGLPEQPFKMHLLPCLSVRQAQLFEALLHDLLKNYKTRGEWFTHPNVKHFSDVLQSKVQVIFDLFDSFGYEPDSETIDLDGLRPVLYENGFVSHLYDPSESEGVGE